MSIKVASIGFSERNNKLVFEDSVKYALAMAKELKETNSKTGSAVVDIAKYTLKLALCVIAGASFGIEV